MESSNLLAVLDEVVLSPDEEDYLIWAPNKKGSFLVSSATFELDKKSCPSSPDFIKSIWSGLVPHIIEVFTWLALSDKINSKERLVQSGIILPPEAPCIFCQSHIIESTNHLFLHCDFTWKIWK